MGHEDDGKDTLPINHAADFYVLKKNDCTESSTVSSNGSVTIPRAE